VCVQGGVEVACPVSWVMGSSCGSAVVNINISNSSLNVPILQVSVGGLSSTWVGYGPDFTINSGDNGNFTNTQIGTQDVVIAYGNHIPAQRITFTDSANITTCQTLNGTGGTFTITNATITGGTTIYVVVEDGICP